VTSPEQVKSYIEEGLACVFAQVTGDGRHFEAIIVSSAFRGLRKVQQHQLVYRALGDRMRDEIHALSMQTYTPDEWTARQI
jgi:acid stress-induced BolA-like protein IbaG/YrbA